MYTALYVHVISFSSLQLSRARVYVYLYEFIYVYARTPETLRIVIPYVAA